MDKISHYNLFAIKKSYNIAIVGQDGTPSSSSVNIIVLMVNVARSVVWDSQYDPANIYTVNNIVIKRGINDYMTSHRRSVSLMAIIWKL